MMVPVTCCTPTGDCRKVNIYIEYILTTGVTDIIKFWPTMDENDFARLFEPTETQVNMIYSMDREGTSPHRCHFK